MNIPLMNPQAQLEHIMPELESLVVEVMRSGKFVLGPNVKAFEQEAASYLGTAHAIGVANGTDALTISMRALGIGPGDEVICPAYTFYATCETIASIGAKPVFADVDPVTWTLDPESVRERISGSTKAVIAVHLFGQCADMNALNDICKPLGIAVIEDAAQAWGATYEGRRAGSLGDIATFSFYPTKNLPCFGDGGLVSTSDAELEKRVRLLRFHGSEDKKIFTDVGYNSRLDEMQAAILRRLLLEVDGWNSNRRKVAQWYEQHGLGNFVELPGTREARENIHHLYVVRTSYRDEILAECSSRGIGAAIYYGNPHHLQPVFENLGYAPGDLPVTEMASREVVSLPMFPTMTEEQVKAVVEAVGAAVPAAAATTA